MHGSGQATCSSFSIILATIFARGVVLCLFFKYRIEGTLSMAQAREKDLSTKVSVPSFATDEQCNMENMKLFELWFPAL